MELTEKASIRAANGGSSRTYVAGEFAGTGTCAFDPKPDARRYAACGDGVVAPVSEWIARRIAAAAGA